MSCVAGHWGSLEIPGHVVTAVRWLTQCDHIRLPMRWGLLTEGAVRGLPRGQEARRRPHSRSRLQGSRSAAQRCSLARGAACRHVPSACQGCPRPRAVLHPPPPRCLLEPAGQLGAVRGSSGGPQRWERGQGPGSRAHPKIAQRREGGPSPQPQQPRLPPPASLPRRPGLQAVSGPPSPAWLGLCSGL